MNIIDAVGNQINIGDTVVYAVNTRYGGLQMGTVEDLIPYIKDTNIKNPAWNPNLPTTYRIDGDNPRWITQPQTHYKIKVRADDYEYDNGIGGKAIEKGKAKTLDNPRRFAVVQRP